MVQDLIIRCIYALLPDKSEDTYRRFFGEVRNTLDLEHSPQDIIIAFEIAAINAVAATFEGTEMKRLFLSFVLEYVETNSKKWTSTKIHR